VGLAEAAFKKASKHLDSLYDLADVAGALSDHLSGAVTEARTLRTDKTIPAGRELLDYIAQVAELQREIQTFVRAAQKQVRVAEKEARRAGLAFDMELST
jgi:hypothetical protein